MSRFVAEQYKSYVLNLFNDVLFEYLHISFSQCSLWLGHSLHLNNFKMLFLKSCWGSWSYEIFTPHRLKRSCEVSQFSPWCSLVIWFPHQLPCCCTIFQRDLTFRSTVQQETRIEIIFACYYSGARKGLVDEHISCKNSCKFSLCTAELVDY